MSSRMWGKKETSYTVGGNVNWYNNHEKQSGVSSKAKNRNVN
jgi:hypothetical protein